MKNRYTTEKLRQDAVANRARADSLVNTTGRIRWNATFSSVYAKESKNAL